ncbi:GNAT family N-acetyltransferase [Cohnella sp. CFH 77786]|uniref:GNAT family N-acetyltransferase n=1 Tax=Cohnella sp. CFH 77786 TaxID=2662265 RepID=UPI001C60897C|nr:GNAT family N-acetyltransferase [Cohnella sp. CFH 77786]MBW5446529.1 GNAT family N-acetyltransferase [Cohnella sp. CFH 77786]
MIQIREISEDDNMLFLQLNKQLDQETNFMLFEPGERSTTLEQQRQIISTFIQSKNSNIFVAELDTQLVGHLTVIGGNLSRIEHRAHLVIGILNKFIGQGIGNELFNHLEVWRQTTCITRLELTVITQNERAISLYNKHGFEIEGIKKNSMKINHEYFDEYMMGKTF